MIFKYRPLIIAVFAILSLCSVYYATQLKFSFSFEQFFPQGDKDLEFYQAFTKEFESDDNFLLIAIENEPTIFDSLFLDKFHELSLEVRDIPQITKVQSLTMLESPVKTPFGYSTIPIIHKDDPQYYDQDKSNILADERFLYNLIDSTASSLVIAAKTKQDLSMSDSRMLTDRVDELIAKYDFDGRAHILGRAYFQRELIDFQKKELLMSFIASIILVSIIMVLIYRKPVGIVISLGSIALGLLLFLGYLGASGKELNAISALFPVIMLIVGSSDVIHIFSKYVDELNLGKEKNIAMLITIKEIGLATLMTSVTTSIGFCSLSLSKLKTIQDFGWNAAVGVMIAYFTVILFTTSVLSLFDKEKIIKSQYYSSNWTGLLSTLNNLVSHRQNRIFLISALSVIVFAVGILSIGTNYNIEDNLPKGAKVTKDFKFFEQRYAGFRPLEFAITSKTDEKADDFNILNEVNKIEEKIKSTGVIKSSISLAGIYRSIHKMNNGNADDAYIFPKTKEEFYLSKRLLEKVVKDETNVLVSKDKTKTRISSRITDLGADKIKELGINLDRWVDKNIDTSLIEVRRTGTGLILDKNSEYVTASLIQGLGLSIVLVTILMGILFKSGRMLLLALIPNVFPLLFAAAMLGYFSIELEAGVAIMFTIIFGIAVDDTIHFLGRFKICKSNGLSNQEAIKQTIHETGKAIIFTTIILFFGFFNMIFSVNPPTFTVGILISVTLVGALICDLLLLPALLLRFMKEAN